MPPEKMYRPEEAIQIGLVDELADSKEQTMDKCRNMLQSVPEARAMKKNVDAESDSRAVGSRS
jgi:enoyl-CoA hydratase/carnithine racemase